MFELSKKEYENLRSQFAISSWGGTRYAPMAFTEHGALMISSVLKSDRAIKVNIQIMRAFTKLRHLILDNVELSREIENLRLYSKCVKTTLSIPPEKATSSFSPFKKDRLLLI